MKNNNCPVCNKETTLEKTNLHRPFCSERCRLLDLGDWINENHTISEPTPSSLNNTDSTKH